MLIQKKIRNRNKHIENETLNDEENTQKKSIQRHNLTSMLSMSGKQYNYGYTLLACFYNGMIQIYRVNCEYIQCNVAK